MARITAGTLAERRGFSLAPLGPDNGRLGLWLWPALLLIADVVGSKIFACVTPFAAFSAIAVATLPMRRALIVTALVWLTNQAVGYGLSGYPWTLDSLAWGVAIGAAALIGTGAAAAAFRGTARFGVLASLMAALAGAFLAYEAMLFATALSLGGIEEFAPAEILRLAVLNAAWLAGLAAGYEIYRLATVRFTSAA